MEKKNTERIKGVICGALVGIVNSVFGGGGGMIAVPLLQKMGEREKEAHATAILVILPICAFSFFFYVFQGLYDFSVLIPTAIGVTAGGILGAKLLGKLSTKTVALLFCFLQALAGAFLCFS